MADIGETLRQDLRDAEFAEVYADGFLDSYVSTQIKVLREQRGMTQSQLAQALGTTQTVISRIENVNYSSWNVRTLKRLAKAFQVRLRVSFETYGSLIEDMERFSRPALERVSLDCDPALYASAETDIDAVAIAATGQDNIATQAILGVTSPQGQVADRGDLGEAVSPRQDVDDARIRRLFEMTSKPQMLRSDFPMVASQEIHREVAYGAR